MNTRPIFREVTALDAVVNNAILLATALAGAIAVGVPLGSPTPGPTIGR